MEGSRDAAPRCAFAALKQVYTLRPDGSIFTFRQECKYMLDPMSEYMIFRGWVGYL